MKSKQSSVTSSCDSTNHSTCIKRNNEREKNHYVKVYFYVSLSLVNHYEFRVTFFKPKFMDHEKFKKIRTEVSYYREWK